MAAAGLVLSMRPSLSPPPWARARVPMTTLAPPPPQQQQGCLTAGHARAGAPPARPGVACRAATVAVREEEEAFMSAAAVGHTLLPLRGCIFSDHLTPVLAYRCRVREDDREAPNFLFESVEQGSNVGRYSVLGAQPAMEIVAKANRVTVMDHEMRTKKEPNRDLLILHCQ
ncbi:anthranilate synthase alpha subunit 1, chloroplastic [Hordeum vulgare]|nr:anthranilate synthase alpha subunit 1, chloroplastic [Hordeum vulgare]